MAADKKPKIPLQKDDTPLDRFAWLRRPVRLYMFVFGLFLLLHIFIFRDVIAAIPSILAGNASIVREELVPFFSFATQFWGEGTSALTSSEEVRVSYSFWTAWVRHNNVLPFAVVILNALSAFILFYAFHRIGRYFYKQSLFGVVAAMLAALLIHTILLYAKMAHFYVLIIGFSMFALSLSLMCEQLFFKSTLNKKNILLVSALTLFNPAIHYHVIFYVVTALIMAVHLLFTLVLNRTYFWRYLRRSFIYFVALILLSLVPYVTYIYFTSSSSLGDVSTQIPVNYWMIYYASLSLPFIFSLDTAGHLDLIRYGNYLAPIPRFGSMLVMFLVGGLALFASWKRLHVVLKVFLLTMFIVMLFAMWMTIGYSDNSPYSFHKVLGNLALFFSEIGGVGATIASMVGTFINILRFPHRFQFIYFYAAGLLFMVALVWLRQAFMPRFSMAVASVMVACVAILPLVASNDYRTALTSGDLASFVAPYTIPQDLKNIKAQLANQQGHKLFILPTLESGREIKQDGQSYSFLDKYLIYYLNQPTLYYGAGANTENKLASYLVYRAIAYKEPWWEYILANNLGITDIVVPKTAQQRDRGITYLPGIEKKIQASLASAARYQKTYSGDSYELYSLRESPDEATTTMLNMQWQDTITFLNSANKPNENMFFPLQVAKYEKAEGEKLLRTDSAERSFYDFYHYLHKRQAFVPQPVSLPFSPKYVASSNFTNNTLSLSTLYAKNNQYNFLQENIPSLMNLQRPSFVGLTKGDVELDLNVRAANAGKYRLLLHAASKADEIKATMNGQTLPFKKLAADQGSVGDFIDFTYYFVDVALPAGSGVIKISNTNQNALVVDSLMLMPEADIPVRFEDANIAGIQFMPTGESQLYKVELGAKQ